MYLRVTCLVAAMALAPMAAGAASLDAGLILDL